MWRSYVYACLLIGLGFKVDISAPLVCYACSTNQRCTGLDTAQGSVAHLCFDQQVCKKDVMRDLEIRQDGSVIIKYERISRGCITYDPSKDTLNKCVRKWRKNDEEGLRCLCNDTNYCNGGHPLNYRNPRSRIPAIMQMVGLTAITVLIVNQTL